LMRAMESENAKPVVAVFDFDGTVTYVDSFLPFLREVCGRVGFWLRMLWVGPALGMHLAGLIGNSKAKEIFLRVFLGGRSGDSLRASASGFVVGRLASLVNPGAMERVEWHRARGHRLLLLSASPELYLELWAAANGFEKVLGTRLELREGRVTGRLAGLNCHGSEKVDRLRAELGDLSGYEIHSYGDSRSDRILLDQVDHPGYRSFEGPSRLRYRLRGWGRFLRALW